jgi:tetratricopeptide (TPR) repeat protein
MIVKNESRIIIRLLETVLPLIDGYCICDTGSTDNTIELITEFFKEREIYGKIIQEPFQDFGYNRTIALKACETYMPNMEYILLLDADMILVGPALQHPTAFKQNLEADMYHLYQGSHSFYYKNARIVRNNKGFTYWGVTHEYVNSPPNISVGTIERDLLFISDIGDGGAKGDKTERDIRLLKKGLEEIPNNDRYTFYLANSYRDSGQNQNAIDTYKKRIEIGGWIEEIWFSHYSIGNCYMRMGEDDRAICAWLAGYNAYPNRIENLYKIIEHYRVRGKNRIAYEFYLMAEKSRRKYTNWSDYLFLERDVYDYKIDYEFSILGYYVNENESLTKDLVLSSMKIMNYPHLEENTYKNVMNNYKFYVSAIAKTGGLNKDATNRWNNTLNSVGKNLGIDLNEYMSSTPSMTWYKGNLIVNVRYVNYRIDDRGGYVNRDQIRTINVIAIVDTTTTEPKILDEFILEYDMEENGRYVGLEDIRLHSQDNVLYYNANRGLKNGDMRIENGTIQLAQKTCKNSVHLKREGSGYLEKNWTLFQHHESAKPKVVYGWSPLIIGTIENGDTFVEYFRNANMPACFKHLRGSTNGVKIDDEIWFFAHAVSYEDRRYYYHMVVVMDSQTFQVKKYTPYFTFEKEKVEYTLGFSYFEIEDELLVGYSTYDKTTKYAVFDKKYFDSMMYVAAI